MIIRTWSQMEDKRHENCFLYPESGQFLLLIGQTVLLIANLSPTFATKYSLESSRRDLHNALRCAAFKSQMLCSCFRISTKYHVTLCTTGLCVILTTRTIIRLITRRLTVAANSRWYLLQESPPPTGTEDKRREKSTDHRKGIRTIT